MTNLLVRAGMRRRVTHLASGHRLQGSHHRLPGMGGEQQTGIERASSLHLSEKRRSLRASQAEAGTV